MWTTQARCPHAHRHNKRRKYQLQGDINARDSGALHLSSHTARIPRGRTTHSCPWGGIKFNLFMYFVFFAAFVWQTYWIGGYDTAVQFFSHGFTVSVDSNERDYALQIFGAEQLRDNGQRF